MRIINYSVIRPIHLVRSAPCLTEFRRTFSTDRRTFSTESGSTVSEERARKLKALFGVTSATEGQKPLGMPIKGINSGFSGSADAAVIGNAGGIGKELGEGKEEESAEKAWLDSGYIEYMNNQKDKGWKS